MTAPCFHSCSTPVLLHTSAGGILLKCKPNHVIPLLKYLHRPSVTLRIKCKILTKNIILQATILRGVLSFKLSFFLHFPHLIDHQNSSFLLINIYILYCIFSPFLLFPSHYFLPESLPWSLSSLIPVFCILYSLSI